MSELIVKGMMFGFGVSFLITSVYILLWIGIVKSKKAIERSNPWYIVREYLEE